MFSSLASLLLLGAVPPMDVPTLSAARPGIEVFHVTSPTVLKNINVTNRLSASGVLLLDVKSGEVLLSKNPDQQRPMASLTKIMTALLVLEEYPLYEVMMIPKSMDQIPGSTIGLKAGEHFSIGSLLKGLLIHSGNDAAYTLAMYKEKSVAHFVQKMNKRAAALGLKNTHFTNHAGLDNEQQYSSPRDLAWLTVAALRNNEFRSIVQTKTAKIFTNEGREFDLRNTNELLHENDHVRGVKTGTTDAAGECLIVLFEKQGREYLLVLLGAKDRYTDSLYILKAVQDALPE